ncbi:MAG: hypothetical protein D6770_03770 [Anaerolineae bacterium]|nr:MAG: hypothetical protein D6770_03770 [Anaerolineae bacterium]
MNAFIAWFSLALLFVTAPGILLGRGPRWRLGFLATQYLGVFGLVLLHWPLAMAAVKLVTGWMASALLGSAYMGMGRDERHEETEGQALPQGRLFHLFMAGLVALTVVAVTPSTAALFPGIGQIEVTGSLLLMGMGLLHLGVTARPLRVTIGLLTVLAGFEILYAALENSILVAALLAGINLGLAVIGSYLIITTRSQEKGEV